MPSINLSYINVAMNAFGLVVIMIIFSACLREWISRKVGSKSFLALLSFIMIALVANIVSWLFEGHPDMSTVIMLANTVASSSGQLAMICFMEYLCAMLYANSKAAKVTLNIFRVLCYASVIYAIGNVHFGYSFVVSPEGHYVHSGNVTMVMLHLAFSVMAFGALILMALLAKRSANCSRVSFIIYTLFPIAGIVIEYIYHGVSLTHVGIVVSVLVIYTDIYLQKQRMIDAQRNALMLSQINPHFTYNTLSAIAAMCDSSPKLAKSLTIDFSRYLRQNLDNVMNEETIPFDKELEHVECYLKIEKARFREKLNVIYSIQCKDFCIPPLTIQPLVENAVKHGITQKPSGGTVRIVTYAGPKSYFVEIIDDGAGFDTDALQKAQDDRRHIGLENVENRVKRMCNGSISVKSAKNIGTRVVIEIPRRKGKKK